ncbi:MAG: PepSY domain-containing protein [Hymenobacteraceae bacterium]|nr:PepSY domain-containing protein [Hymenobacteraceae bacterium]
MKLKSKQYYIRKSHRYLGVILGVQFLFWTLGGLYFSWNDIDEVHGDHLRSEKKYFPASMNLVSPQVVLERLQAKSQVDSVLSVQLIEIAGVPAYQVRYFSGGMDHSAHEAGGHMPSHAANVKVQLANAETGEFMSPLSEEVAVTVARNQMADPIKVEKVEYLTEVGSHHEYREKPLPAWAVTFSQPDNCTVYVSAELGTFQAIRHNQWRVFDFFWMLHTMDYEGRDNFGNILLRLFSIFGLFTVVSGFVLYYMSSPSVRKVKKRVQKVSH